MSYVPREYPAIVRDLLTTLTGGTVRESLDVPDPVDILEPLRLRDRPIRRISHLEGTIVVGKEPETTDLPYRFTPADFELVSLSGAPDEFDAIRFRKNGRAPKPGSTLTVNYYPLETRPLPLTDLNVGSVVRTLVETIAREMAMGYLNLESVYQSAFLDTATGNALDKVVALVGISRLPSGHPLAKIRFTRQSSSTGRISVPAGTSVTDAAGSRYLTLTTLTLEPGETSRDVMAAGESIATKLVAEGEIDRLELLIAGIAAVTNPEPAHLQSSPESDDALRRRTRTALSGLVRGTVSALEFAVRSIPGVRDVAVREMPNGIAGEIKIEVAYENDDEETRALVRERIDDYRPAGIRVISADAARQNVAVTVALTLAGARLADPTLAQVKSGIESRLIDYLEGLPPDGTIRTARLSALVMEDQRVVDAAISLAPDLTGQPLAAVLEVTGVSFPTPAYEKAPSETPATTAAVTVDLPIILVTGVTLAAATTTIEQKLTAHLAGRSPSQPLTAAGLLDAIRDDSQFAAVRTEALVTVEDAGGRFQQLSDGVGTYTPSPNETLQKSALNLAQREGSI